MTTKSKRGNPWYGLSLTGAGVIGMAIGDLMTFAFSWSMPDAIFGALILAICGGLIVAAADYWQPLSRSSPWTPEDLIWMQEQGFSFQEENVGGPNAERN